MIKKIVSIVLLINIIVWSCPAFADSLWKSAGSYPYTTQKAYRVGDVITILIVESSTAAQGAGTKTGWKDDLSAGISHNIGGLQPLIGTGSHQLKVGGENKYSGTGQTTRQSNVQAKIAVTVTNILPNGNLEISGKHKVLVNEETQEISVKGVVRPKDVTLGNTIYSYQVSDAEVSIKGWGAVGAGAAPGFLTRILDWIF
jgi:flagellar L-ring protein precursor FlgH